MKKKFAIIVSILILLSNSITVQASNPSSWAKEEIENAINLGFVPEELQGNYQTPITRAEFCSLAVRFYETFLNKEITEERHFVDTNDINVIKSGGIRIIAGVSQDRFNPDGLLNREQAAVILSMLSSRMGVELTNRSHIFSDGYQVSSWALESVQRVKGSNIMDGMGKNNFVPKGNYTIEESIITIMRLNRELKEKMISE